MAPGHHDPAGETWAVGSCYQAGAQGLDHFGIFGLEIIGRSSHFRGIRYVCISKILERVSWHNAKLRETYLLEMQRDQRASTKAFTHCHKAPATFFLTPRVT